MNNKTKPMKAIDFQNKVEGKLVKHEELLMSARDRMLKTENTLRDLKESVELDKDAANKSLACANLDIMFWQFMTGITTVTVVTMVAYYVFG